MKMYNDGRDKAKYNVLSIGSDSYIDDSVIIAAAKTIVCMTNSPLDIFDILGITDDLQRMRTSSRSKTTEPAPIV